MIWVKRNVNVAVRFSFQSNHTAYESEPGKGTKQRGAT
jgi:hypothetical protein